jgi:hypothetical protein
MIQLPALGVAGGPACPARRNLRASCEYLLSGEHWVSRGVFIGVMETDSQPKTPDSWGLNPSSVMRTLGRFTVDHQLKVSRLREVNLAFRFDRNLAICLYSRPRFASSRRCFERSRLRHGRSEDCITAQQEQGKTAVTRDRD